MPLAFSFSALAFPLSADLAFSGNEKCADVLMRGIFEAFASLPVAIANGARVVQAVTTVALAARITELVVKADLLPAACVLPINIQLAA